MSVLDSADKVQALSVKLIMSRDNDSIERLEQQVRRLDEELTPRNREGRKELINALMSATPKFNEDLVLYALCMKYIEGEITMRELSKLLVENQS